MSLQPTPTDWVADFGASYHTSPDPNIVSQPHPRSPTFPSSIIVGNGSTLSITSVGDTVLPNPLYLNNILVAPNIIHNLLSIRRFTTANHCSMEFDLSGLTIRDLTTRAVVARCDNPNPLYSIRFPAPPPSSCVATPYTLAVTASASTLHRRLCHPGHDVLSRLSPTSSIPRPRGNATSPCHAYQLGRHTRLPFTSAMSRTARLFEFVHCDLWTSSIPSLFGNQYYLVILDDFSHYL
jgi:hypothetical protein